MLSSGEKLTIFREALAPPEKSGRDAARLRTDKGTQEFAPSPPNQCPDAEFNQRFYLGA